MHLVFNIFFLLSIVSSKLSILGPQSLKDRFAKNNSTIDVVYANFGHIPYGQSMEGKMVYSEKNAFGCNRNEFPDREQSLETKKDEHNLYEFTLLERGDCHFVTKVRNVALNGGDVAIIIDNKNEDITGVVMSDDGTGAGIRIPSVLIGNGDGMVLKEYLKTASAQEIKQIRFNIQFLAPLKGNMVFVDLWYTNSDRKTMNFVNGLGVYLEPMASQIYFSPRYVTYACEKCTASFKSENCVSDGKYCATSHMNAQNQNDGKLNEVTGKDIILENIHQYVLENKLNGTMKFHFFEYLKFVNSLCGVRITKKCHDLGLKRIGLDIEEMEEEINRTFIKPGDLDSENYILKKIQTERHKIGLHIYPAVVINDVTFRGQLNPDNVFEAICASFKDMPSGCLAWEKKVGITNDLVNHTGDVTTSELIIIVTVLVTVNLFLACWYRRLLQEDLKKDMKIQVSSAVSQYVALSEIPELNESTSDQVGETEEVKK